MNRTNGHFVNGFPLDLKVRIITGDFFLVIITKNIRPAESAMTLRGIAVANSRTPSASKRVTRKVTEAVARMPSPYRSPRNA
jgi:hypothetical protein